MKIWTPEEEANNLRARFAAISNKAAFAREIQLKGGPSMLNQHIHGHRPLNLAAAGAYAKGFGVPLAEISPRLAAAIADAPTAGVTNMQPAEVEPPAAGFKVLIDLGELLRRIDATDRKQALAIIEDLVADPGSAEKMAAKMVRLLGESLDKSAEHTPKTQRQ